jgi:predicted SpoU family rRNA methylase
MRHRASVEIPRGASEASGTSADRKMCQQYKNVYGKKCHILFYRNNTARVVKEIQAEKRKLINYSSRKCR